MRLSLMFPAFALMLACNIAMSAEIVPIRTPLSAATESRSVLTLNGDGKRHQLTLADLERLAMQQTTLTTPWGVQGTFQGLLIKDLFAAYDLNPRGKRIVIRALDGYVAGLSDGEFARAPALLATRMEGRPIPTGNKGPLILLWPSREADARAGRAPLSSWVWSITEITLE